MSENRDRYIILADVPPRPDEYNLSVYKDSGIDTYVFTEDYLNYSLNRDQYIDALKLMDRIGLNVFIRGLGDSTVNYFEKFGTINFNDFKCVKGFYITDEPGAKKFNDIYLNNVIWKNKYYPALYWHLNLFPSYAGDALGTKDYKTYIDEYADKVLLNVKGEKSIGFDHYPLRFWNGKKAMTDKWLYDLYVVAEKAKELGCRYSFCIQSFTDGDAWRVLTDKAEVEFQISTALAFGVNSFEFFTYNSLTFSEGTFTGMVKEGEKTQYYEYVKECISFLRSFEKKYFQYDWQGIHALKGYKNNGNNLEHIEKFSMGLPQNIKAVSDSDAVIGVFKGKKDALLLANPNDPANNCECNIELSFNKETELSITFGKSQIVLKTKKENFKLESGEMVFIEIGE